MELKDITADNLATLTAQGYTEQDLSMLAPSEVQALLAVPTDDAAATAGATDPHEAAAAAQDAAAAAAAAAGGEKPAGEKTGAEAGADEGAAVAATDRPFVPQYSAEVPPDAKEKITALQAEEADAFKKLMDGEISAEDYQAVRTRTSTEIDTIKEQSLTAKIFEQANQQTADQLARAEWTRAETASFNAFKTEGLDYKARPALLAAYNTHLKALGADPKNENRDAQWFLTEAHRLTKADLGIVTNPGTKPGDATATRSGVDPAEIPPTLRNVPMAAANAVNADEFAHMRNLTGLELEKAHARLTPEQRDRWMSE